VSKLAPAPNIRTRLGFPAGQHYNGGRPIVLRGEARRLPALTTPPNPGPDEINQEQFDRLLGWLDPDREKAGAKYEWIRKRLIKIFMSRASNTPEELADKTINRVAHKLPEIQASYVGDPAHYFCGVAINIFRESLRKDRIPAITPPEPSPPDEESEQELACLEKCVERLPQPDRNLVMAYYQLEKHAKIDHRKKLAEELGLGMNALRIRACRIRASLMKCTEDCLAEARSA